MYPHNYRRRNGRKTIRNTAITIFVMLLLVVTAGVIYVYISGQHPYVKPDDSKKAVDNYKALKAKPPNPSSPASAAIESLLSPVSLGSNTSVTVGTVPTSKCSISVTYNEVPSKDSGLIPKTADEWGHITWTWTVEKTAPVGKWPVKVTCLYGKKSAVVVGDLLVTK